MQDKIEKTLRILYDASKGDMTKIDRGYLEALDYEYSDGDVCRISEFAENIDTFDTFEEFRDYVAPLIKGNPEGDYSLPFDFAEQDDETMLKQVIGTVYLDGVAAVSDTKRQKLSEDNNWGFNADKGQWEGYFLGEDGTAFEYRISKKSGKWGIEYKVAK